MGTPVEKENKVSNIEIVDVLEFKKIPEGRWFDH